MSLFPQELLTRLSNGFALACSVKLFCEMSVLHQEQLKRMPHRSFSPWNMSHYACVPGLLQKSKSKLSSLHEKLWKRVSTAMLVLDHASLRKIVIYIVVFVSGAVETCAHCPWDPA